MLHKTILDRGSLSLLEEYCSLPFLNLSNALFSTVNFIKSDFVFDYGKRIKMTEIYGPVRMYAIEENIAMKMNFGDAENDQEPVLLKEKITWSQLKKNILKNAKSNKL